MLARWLAPEAFGLASLVFVSLQGLELLSDVGLSQSITRSRRGDDPAFLNTAWTLQLLRGGLLFACALALAGPMAWLYGAPELGPLLVAASFQALFAGLNSTSFYTLRRRVEVGRLVAIDLLGQVLNVTVMLVWAWHAPSPWALIAGGITNTSVRLVASHRVAVGYRNRLTLDAAALREILELGKWVLGSSGIFFVGRQGDRLLLGHFLGVRMLGVYSIAVTISEAVGTVIERVSHNVFYPILSRAEQTGPEEVRRVYYRARLHLDAASQPALGALMVLGSTLVEWLWDERYAAAGWMLEVLCIRVAMSCTLYPCDRALLALGRAPLTLYRSAGRALWIVVGIPAGWTLGGIEGLVWATALAEVPVLLILWPPFHRAGLLRIERELLAPLFLALGAGAALLARPWLVAWTR